MNSPLTSYDLSKLTVLIVEKHAPVRSLLRQVLRVFGIGRVYDANTPEHGFEEFKYRAPDLVLVDWSPDFDGIGLVKRIRTDKESCFPQVPIILVTAFGETKRIYEALDAGMSEYLVKPVSANLLYLHIVNAIENARPFIRTETHTGPCRRRHKLPLAGKERRQSGAEAAGRGSDTPRHTAAAIAVAEAAAKAKAA